MSLAEAVDMNEGDLLPPSESVLCTMKRNRSMQETPEGLLPSSPWSSSPPRCSSPSISISRDAISLTLGITSGSSAADATSGRNTSATSLVIGCSDGDTVASASVLPVATAEAMTTSRCSEIKAATLDDNKKKSEPVLAANNSSPTLQIKCHPTESYSPTSLSPSQSPKLGGRRSPDIRLSPVLPLAGNSPSPTAGGNLAFPEPPSTATATPSASSRTPVTDAATDIPTALHQSTNSLTESHASLDRSSESSVRSQESAFATTKATADHQSSTSRADGVVLRASDRSDRSDQLSRSCEKSDRSDKTDKKGSDQGDKSDKCSKIMEKKKKTSSWYNMLNPSYKSKSEDFKRLFKDLPETERLIVDYSCALQRDILVHGRLYVTQNFVCFYANIFRWETNVVIRCRDITSMTKEKTARVIPNAVQVCTEHEKHFFTSFGARDKTYLMLFRIWQNALMEQPMSTQELWQWVHYSYGDELGLTSDDDDYVAPPYLEDDHKNNNSSSSRLPPPAICEKSDLTPGDLEEDEALAKMDCSAYEALSSEVNELDDNENSGDGDRLPTLLSTARENLAKTKHSDIPTDMSDTTESEAVEACEAPCPSPTHEGKEHLNIVLPISVDQLFTLLFTGSRFFHDLLTSRKTYDVTESNWQPCPETGHKLRQVTYTITLNHAMAKAAQTTETQILMKQSKPGLVYAIDCDVLNTGIPYSDAFCVKSHYCLSRISDSQCRLRVYGCIRYKKSVWGLVKSVIEKNAMQGLADFCNDLEAALLRESDRLQPASKKMKRRKRMKVLDAMGNLESTKELLHTSSSQTCFRKYTSSGSHVTTLQRGHPATSALITVLGLLMVIIVIQQAVLLYKLWTPGDSSAGKSLDIILFEKPPSTNEEWKHLLAHREAMHRMEAEKWKEAIAELIKLIRTVEDSLLDLQGSLGVYSTYRAAPSTAEKTTASQSLPNEL